MGHYPANIRQDTVQHLGQIQRTIQQTSRIAQGLGERALLAFLRLSVFRSVMSVAEPIIRVGAWCRSCSRVPRVSIQRVAPSDAAYGVLPRIQP